MGREADEDIGRGRGGIRYNRGRDGSKYSRDKWGEREETSWGTEGDTKLDYEEETCKGKKKDGMGYIHGERAGIEN